MKVAKEEQYKRLTFVLFGEHTVPKLLKMPDKEAERKFWAYECIRKYSQTRAQ